MDHPSEFEEILIGCSFLFKIEAKAASNSHFDYTFKVSKICSDPVIISKFGDPTIIAKLITQQTEPEFYSAENDFLEVTPRKSIEQLKDCTDVSLLNLLRSNNILFYG